MPDSARVTVEKGKELELCGWGGCGGEWGGGGVEEGYFG